MVVTSSSSDDYVEYTDEEFDALPPLEKWEVLVHEKREVEAELGSLSAAKFREEHAIILRRNLPEKVSRDTWIKRRNALTAQREELLLRKTEVEDLLQSLRPEVDELKAKRRDAVAADAPVVSELRRLIDTVTTLVNEVRSLRLQAQGEARHDENPAAAGIAG